MSIFKQLSVTAEKPYGCPGYVLVMAALLVTTVQQPTLAAVRSVILEEVVVTARKREESLMDVPMSITALQGEQLEFSGIEDATDLVGKIPGLSQSSDLLSPGKDFNYLVIRGVGANTGGDPAVPVFVDGVYQPRLGYDMDFVDVQRVEVLRGPQGTLFGRNTQGGAVNIVSRRPNEEFRGKVRFVADDFPSYKGLVSLSGALSDTLFASASVEGGFTEGYLENIGSGQVNQGGITTNPSSSADDGRDIKGRGSLRWVPSDTLEVYLVGDYSEFNGLWGLPGVPRGCNCYKTNNEFQLDAQDENYGGSLNIDWRAGWADITAITGYRFLSTTLPFDFDGGTDRGPNFHDFRTEQEFFSQELRFSINTHDDRARWLGGIYYFHEEIDSLRRYSLLDVVLFPSGLVIDQQDTFIERDGWAAFGQVDIDLTENLTLTGGVRYSTEDADGHLELDFTIFDFLGPGTDFQFVAPDDEDDTFDGTTWTASLSYHISDETTVHFTTSKGFKAGGFPLSAADPASFIQFDNESSLNYELGIKGRFFDSRLQLEAAAFHIELEDQQLAALIQVVLPGTNVPVPVATTANAGESTSSGFELTASGQPTERLGLTAAIGYTETEFDDYIDSSGLQRAGEPFRFTPELTANITGEYVFPVMNGKYDLSLYASYTYVDDYRQGFAPSEAAFDIDSYELLDVSASLVAEKWELQLFVDNVADKYVETRAWDTFFFVPLGSRVFSSVLPPRKFGVRFTYQF